MNEGQYFLAALGMFVLGLIIIYSIIQSATKSTDNNKLLRMQVALLVQLAIKAGVEKEKVNEIIDNHT